jgi:hypothetical protein
MRGAVDHIDAGETFPEVKEGDAPSAVVIDCDPTTSTNEALMAAQHAPGIPVVVIVHASRTTELLPWIEQIERVHLLQQEHVERFDDLHVTLRKLVTHDLFGLERYFAWGARSVSMSARSSAQRPQIVLEVERFAEDLGLHPRMRNLISTVIDEFLSNAFYNAPTHADGTHRFRELCRTEPVDLGDREEIVVRFCGDGRRIGLSVTDPFGSLRPAQVQQTLKRGLRRRAHVWERSTGGAGLGFYCAFEALSHLVVNIEASKRTELIGILSVRDTFRDFLASGKSFTLFANRLSVTANAEVTP